MANKRERTDRERTDSGFTYGEASGVYHGLEDTTQGNIEHDKLKKINKKFIESYVNPYKETWGSDVYGKYNVKVPDGDVVTNTLMNDRSRWGGGPKKSKTTKPNIPPISTILPGDNRYEEAVKTIYHGTRDPKILTTFNVDVPTFAEIVKKPTGLGGRKSKKSKKSRKSRRNKK